ncbi:hypothetical protein GCM10029964_117400 [Kibdelosporangium lantanae]
MEEYGPRIWAVARSHRLNEEDAADVFQATLLNLAEHIGHIKQPERISAWIVTTARRECLRVIRLRKPLPLKWRPEEEPEVPEDRVLEDARDQALWSAFKQLPSRCQQLLRLFAYMPEYTYAELGRAMGISNDSVGQAKGRCLRMLRLRLGEVR